MPHLSAPPFEGDDGWFFARCECNYEAGPFPDMETVIDNLMDHSAAQFGLELDSALSDWLPDMLALAVTTDGGHHKQWYLEAVAGQFGIDLPNHEPGIAP